MADSSVAITAGSGTPIRVLTGLGTGSADQQVITLADSAGNLLGTQAAPIPVSIAQSGGQSTTSGSITAAAANTPGTGVTASTTAQIVANVATAGNVTFHLVTSAFVGTVVFEVAVDAGLNYAPVISIREDGTGADNTLAISTAAAFIRVYTAALPGVAYFRVRCSAFTSGSLAVLLAPGPSLVEPNPSLAASSAVIGTIVESPMLTTSATMTTTVNATPGATGTTGLAAATITAIVSTAAPFIAAPAAGLSIYVTEVNVTNSGATGTLVLLAAGAASVPMVAKYVAATTSAPPSSFRTPIRVGTATALNYTNSAASTSIYVQVAYYVAP